MIGIDGELLVAPGSAALATISQLLLQARLQAVHLCLPALCERLVEIPAPSNSCDVTFQYGHVIG